MNEPTPRRTWIDAHIHVSDLGPDGARREAMLADLLDVLDRSGHDLRFVISPDGYYLGAIAHDVVSPANQAIFTAIQKTTRQHRRRCEGRERFHRAPGMTARTNVPVRELERTPGG